MFQNSAYDKGKSKGIFSNLDISQAEAQSKEFDHDKNGADKGD